MSEHAQNSRILAEYLATALTALFGALAIAFL